VKKVFLYSINLFFIFFLSVISQVNTTSGFSNSHDQIVTSIYSDSTAVKNQMWETTLISTGSYFNPYKDVILHVQYFNSDSTIIFNANGFWDGDSIFKIRAYFPEVGVWTWSTSCSDITDIGLHNKSGSIVISEYDGANELFNHGGLKISSNNKYITHRDGTPFFWIGGTAWGFPKAATYNEWKKYIDDRHAKKFSIVQIAPAKAHGFVGSDEYGSYPVNQNGDSCFFSDDKWNPLYWQEFDRFVEYANSKEIVVVVVGLAEPVYDMLSDEDAKLFTQNLGARMEGYHVILSPAFDTYQTSWNDDYDSIGVTLANSRHLISQHTGHRSAGGPINEFAQYFRSKTYLDFSMNQTGHNGGNIYQIYKKAREWNINLLNEPPMKPVINTEAYYSSGQYVSQISDPERQGTDENARELGWLSLLSGSLGYTYGATGLWNFKEESEPGLVIPLDSALNYVSSSQMTLLTDFFNSFAWWELEPNHNAIIYSGWVAEQKKMALAISENGKFGAAFLPDNNSIKIDMTVFLNSVSATWYNPISGTYTDGEQNVSNTEQHTFTPPVAGEWALLLAPKPIALTLKVFLQGAYSNSKMSTNLSSVIPFEQPYNKVPWNYNGNETIDNIFITTNKIVDWVLIELRTGSSETTIVLRKAVPINEEGYIVDPEDGTTTVKFSWIDPGNYFITVYHRNHISAMSSQAVFLTN